MGVQVEETGPVERRLRVEVPTAEVDAAFDAAYHRMARSTRIRGVRPGRAPRSVLQKVLGDRARAEVLEKLLEKSLTTAIEEADLAVVGDPKLRPEAEPKEGAPFVYEATLEIKPRIELQKVQGLELERPELPEPEEDPVERYLQDLRASHGQQIEEPEGTAAARGRIAIIDYTGTCEGRSFQGGSGQEVSLPLGAGRAVAGFEEQIEGMTVGTERAFDVDLPAEYPVQEVAGKRVSFQVRLVGLKREELPDLDDEFTKDVSEFDTLEAFRDSLRARLQVARDKEAERLLREAAARKVIEENPFPVPSGLVERQLQSRIGRAIGQMGKELPEERIRELVDRWREEWKGLAETGRATRTAGTRNRRCRGD
jgi:trigger factor